MDLHTVGPLAFKIWLWLPAPAQPHLQLCHPLASITPPSWKIPEWPSVLLHLGFCPESSACVNLLLVWRFLASLSLSCWLLFQEVLFHSPRSELGAFPLCDKSPWAYVSICTFVALKLSLERGWVVFPAFPAFPPASAEASNSTIRRDKVIDASSFPLIPGSGWGWIQFLGSSFTRKIMYLKELFMQHFELQGRVL